MIHKNNNQGVFLELLVAAKNVLHTLHMFRTSYATNFFDSL